MVQDGRVQHILFFRFHQLRNSYFFEEISRAIRTFSFALFFLRIAFENSEEIVFKNRLRRAPTARLARCARSGRLRRPPPRSYFFVRTFFVRTFFSTNCPENRKYEFALFFCEQKRYAATPPRRAAQSRRRSLPHAQSL